MKKFLTILAAAVAAFSLSSCNREQFEEVMPSEEGIQLNLTVAELDGTADADTKAVKKGWAKGDKLNIWYDENISQNPDLVIAYDGSKWAVDHSAAVSGKMPAASGTLTAMYVNGSLSDFSYAGEEGTSRFSAPRFSSVIDGANRPARMPIVSYVDRTDYSFASDILTSNLTDWLFRGANVQVVISGLPAGEWALKCDRFRTPSSFNLISNSPVARVMVNTGSAAGNYALSVANKDGRAFMYFCNGTDTDFNFTLFNTGTGEKLVYSVSGKSLDATGYKLNAIKIPFSKFSDPRAVDLGLSVKWAIMNIGATKPEEFGDYFAWGATEPWYESGYAQENPQTHWKSGYTDGYTWRNAPYQTVNTTDEDYTKWTKYVSDTPYYRDPAATDTDAAKTVLDLADDAAHANWGGEWRMPTTEEWEEIKTNCTLVSISNYQGTGVAGTLITSKKAGYTDKSIFIPNAGRREHTNIDGTASHGYYWSSSISNFSGHAYLEEIGGTYFFTSKDDRFLGFSVRAVRK